MNNKSLVSIIIACYNHEKYVKQALDSILEDEYPNKEVLIIDDGSKDSSMNIIENWAREHKDTIDIHCWSRPNKGVCATLNELIFNAKGKYIVLLASDDVLYGNTITERVRILEENEKNGKLVLVSDALVVDSDNNVVGSSSMTDYNRGNKEKYYSDKGIQEEVITNPSISGAVVMINKSIYDKIGTYPEDLFLEDWFFYQRAAAINVILFWDRHVSLYRVHGKNASLTYTPKMISDMIKTYRRNISWFQNWSIRKLIILQIIRLNIRMYMSTIAKIFRNLKKSLLRIYKGKV